MPPHPSHLSPHPSILSPSYKKEFIFLDFIKIDKFGGKIVSAGKVFDEMSLTKVAGGPMILRNIRRHNLLQATAPPGSGHGLLGGYFSTISTPPTEGGSEGVAEKAKQTMDNVVDAAKDTTRKLKDRVMGSTTGGGKTEKPISNNPDLNHGVETTDSSCEDVRDRPGGYS